MSLRYAARAALLLVLAAPAARAQGQIDRDHVPSRERVNLFERRQTNVDGNNVRTTIFNFGQTGRTGTEDPTEVPYEWPKNTRRHYIALTGLFAGAEVVGQSGQREYIVNVPNYRENRDDPNQAWTWAPVSGYVNTADEALGIARSDRPETWPAFWPDKREDLTDPGWAGSWSGYFGKNVFNADQELYYKMGDDDYVARGSTYYPDSTDLSRRGLGLLADTRVLAWSQVLIDDAVFILHSIKNDGTEDLTSVGVTLWLADLVGGDPDASDDRPFFDLLLDTAFITDQDGRSSDSNFPTGQSVGAAIAFFLESPGNATDRIDNDGDGSTGDEASAFTEYGLSAGEPGSPVVSLGFLVGEGDQIGPNLRLRYDGVDNNGNGLVDEDSSNAAFGTQLGVGFADYVDNDGDGEAGSPTVTQPMVSEAAGDRWGRWPSIPEPYGGQPVHLIQVGAEDLGRAFRDNVDNDNDCAASAAPLDFLWEPGSPTVTQEMIGAAAADAPYFRYAVPGTDVVLYDLTQADLGRCYADGVDNDGDGAADEGVDEHIDEMSDERRDDGVDNDGDWRASLDDVGLDGADLTADAGEGDGLPTSGAGTDLPGEANVDVTDVSESDQIGITNVQYRPANNINFQTVSDGLLFNDFLVPGKFTTLGFNNPPPSRDSDLFVSSGVFPLRAGQTERVSFAVILGEVNYPAQTVEARFASLLTKRQNAQEAYEADYRFAQAPVCPDVSVVPGDGQVTLYWDTKAEDSFDSFIADLDVAGLNPRDFEGYRIYRATDPAFLDARVITDAAGNPSFLRPIAQFDLLNGNRGYHPVAVDGVQFDLGTDARDVGEASNGLTHVFTDSTATNGVPYYYAVTSYDFGAVPANISPTECPIAISIRPDGSVDRLGPNVVQVTPSQEAAGYVDPALSIEHPQGFATSTVSYRVVDPAALQDGHLYRITFRDTLALGEINTQGLQTTQDTIRTRDFTLEDVTDGDTLIFRNPNFGSGTEPPISEGFQLLFDNEPLVNVNDSLTRWASADVRELLARRFELTVPENFPGTRLPADYRVVVGPPGFGQSVSFTVSVGIELELPAKPTNFKVFRRFVGADGQPQETEVPFAFWDLTGEDADPYGPGTAATNLLSADPDALGEDQGESDRIIVLEQIEGDRPPGLTPTWEFLLSTATDNRDRRNPQPGDEGAVVTRKPFLATDVYEFTVRGPSFDADAAREALERVRVVPNPYRALSAFEQANPFPTGRGERVIRFVNVPPRCTVRIFTVAGRLVRTLDRNAGSNEGMTAAELQNGSVEWDLLSEDRLSVSYGVYLYHLDAPGVGETTGTFAILK